MTLDVELHLPLGRAGEQDDLRCTIDYQQVYDRVRAVSEERKVHLIEALARRIGEALHSEFPVERVLVRVRKLSLPFDAHLSCVEVELSVPAEAGAPRRSEQA